MGSAVQAAKGSQTIDEEVADRTERKALRKLAQTVADRGIDPIARASLIAQAVRIQARIPFRARPKADRKRAENGGHGGVQYGHGRATAPPRYRQGRCRGATPGSRQLCRQIRRHAIWWHSTYSAPIATNSDDVVVIGVIRQSSSGGGVASSVTVNGTAATQWSPDAIVLGFISASYMKFFYCVPGALASASIVATVTNATNSNVFAWTRLRSDIARRSLRRQPARRCRWPTSR